jgi:hypothetical protein
MRVTLTGISGTCYRDTDRRRTIGKASRRKRDRRKYERPDERAVKRSVNVVIARHHDGYASHPKNYEWLTLETNRMRRTLIDGDWPSLDDTK